MNTPNLTPEASRREAFSIAFIFTILYLLALLMFIAGWWLKLTPLWYYLAPGWGLVIFSAIFAVVISCVMAFTVWDWWLDLKACRKRGMEQTPVTSGVPFMPGATKSIEATTH